MNKGRFGKVSTSVCVHLGWLSCMMDLAEATGDCVLQAFRGFAGTSILILVGVATDTARRVKADQAMQRYKDVDKLYDDV
jgi:preprotein translocase subunit SecY